MRRLPVIATFLFVLCAIHLPALAQSDTTITYQGYLEDNGAPADGLYNVSFSLWDAISGGNVMGSSIGPYAIGVYEGLMSRQLDFGPDAFDGGDRWLQVTINGTPLTPRHYIARAPYAIQTRGIFVNDTKTFVGIGRETTVTGAEIFGLYRNTTGYGGMYVQTAPGGRPFYGYSASVGANAFHYYDGAGEDWRLNVNGNQMITAGTDYIPPNGIAVTRVVLSADLVAVSANLHVSGSLSKAAGSFRIDHPLDPQNKWLYHSFVESPDMKNIYDGVVRTDERGLAAVTLPPYFDALNRDFRYQLTVIDSSDDFVLAKVAREIEGNAFVIRTSAPNTKVSWQVTGIRDDAYARANPIVVEVSKN